VESPTGAAWPPRSCRGAQGATIGTCFLASTEAAAPLAWKEAILAADSEDAIRFTTWKAIMPASPESAYDAVPRVLSTPFIDTWRDRPAEAKARSEQLRGEISGALRTGKVHEVVPFTGQTAGLIDEILPAGEIVRRLVTEAEEALARAAVLAG
jgi:nitronate monooxygenase/enoyl-[acyl-carrier protein] reductase II